MRLTKLFATLISALVLLSACGGATDTETETGTNGETDAPAAETTDEPEPALPESKVLQKSPEADQVDDQGQFQEVSIDNLETYQHPSGLFSLQIPAGWTINDNSKPEEVIILWFDPAQNASIGVDIFDAPPEITDDNLSQLLQQFLQGTFGTQTNFAMSEPEVQPDGSIRVAWGYVESVEGGSGWLQGNSFIQKIEDKVSILNVFVVGSQFDDLQDSLSRVINSYEVDASVQIPPPPATPEAGEAAPETP